MKGKEMKNRIFIFTLLFISTWSHTLFAKTLVLEGNIASKIQMSQQMTFSVDKPVSKLTLRFALPAAFSNKAVRQELGNLNIDFTPQPSQVENETDKFGNHFKRVVWTDITSDATVSVKFITAIRSELSAMESKTGFPLRNIPQGETIYLKATDMVQKDDPEIAELAASLTASARTEYEAVNSILNFIADNIKYTYNPPKYDAKYTLNTKSGNCQNFAHLSIAMLRSVGIPARIVGGISLKDPWKVPVDKTSSLVQSMGQGGHAWMEIFFPDLGWLSYDPQQSKQFTSSRHIKQTHGLDSHDINDTWRGSPYLPRYSEQIDAKFLDDSVALKLKSSVGSPRPYLISNNLLTNIPEDEPKRPVIERPKPPKKPPVEVKKPLKGERVEFGNMEFPNFVDLFQVEGDKGIKIMDKETAEYVTSTNVFAQAVQVDAPLAVEKVSLAMRKFGGDGSIFVDLVADDRGKPGMSGMRSLPTYLDSIPRKPGYYWVDFSFPSDGTVLKKGKYWLVLRRSGDAIMNWFYIPGKPYSSGDDTRSTAKGFRWEDILNYDFVFKVRGVVQGSTAKR
jgi:transglutaminase-like putative cysteine protease